MSNNDFPLLNNSRDNKRYKFYIRGFYFLLFISLVLGLYIVVYSYIIKPKPLSKVGPYDVEIYSIVKSHKDIDKKVEELLNKRELDQPLLECLTLLREADINGIAQSGATTGTGVTNCKKERSIVSKK